MRNETTKKEIKITMTSLIILGIYLIFFDHIFLVFYKGKKTKQERGRRNVCCRPKATAAKKRLIVVQAETNDWMTGRDENRTNSSIITILGYYVRRFLFLDSLSYLFGFFFVFFFRFDNILHFHFASFRLCRAASSERNKFTFDVIL